MLINSRSKIMKDNLYKLWNRMSSGHYFPLPVKAVPIPKKTGGERILGIPTVGDRICQMVAKLIIEPILRTIDTVKVRLSPGLEINGIVPCRVEKRTRLSMDVISDLRKRFNGMVYETCTRETVKLAECPSFWQPITIYDSRSQGAEDYRLLAKELIKRKMK